MGRERGALLSLSSGATWNQLISHDINKVVMILLHCIVAESDAEMVGRPLGAGAFNVSCLGAK